MSIMTEAPITERQHNWLNTLVTERNTSGLYIDLDNMSCSQASRLIDTLLARPRVAAAPAPVVEDAPSFPAGFYAVSVPGDAQDLAFFELDRPTEGRWAGRVFLSQLASDERYPVRGARRSVVMNLIAADYRAAGLRYGQEIGRCCRCHRTLTDEVSRAKGIGPQCEGRF